MSLAGVAAVVVVSVPATNSQVVVTALDGVGRRDVVVTSNTGVNVRLVNGWTYSQITSVTPSFGQRGTVVTIVGIRLLAEGSSVSSVSLAGVPVSQIVSADASTIVVVTWSHVVDANMTGAVTVTVDNGQRVSLDNA